MFTRDELLAIEKKALESINSTEDIGGDWVKAYQELAFAASTLDAFMARIETEEDPIFPQQAQQQKQPIPQIIKIEVTHKFQNPGIGASRN